MRNRSRAPRGRAVVLCLGLLSVAAFLGNAQADALDDILERGAVRIAVPNDFAPFGSVAADGALEGYDIDVANAVARALGVELESVVARSFNRIPLLLSGDADLVISCLGIDPVRAKAIAFSSPYGPFFSAVYGASDLKVEGPEELVGKRVAVTRDTLEDADLKVFAPDGAEIVRYDDNGRTLSAFMSGEVDLVATGNTAIAHVLSGNPRAAIEAKIVLRNSPCSIGVRYSEPRLLHWANVFVLTKKLNGELDRLSRQWLGEALPDLPVL